MIEAIEALKNSGKVIVDEEHDWGYQLRLVNEAEYCGKFLVLDTDAKGSFHYHVKKKETFTILQGVVFLRIDRKNGDDEWVTVFCNQCRPGDCFTLDQLDRHYFKGLQGDGIAVIMEISTHDDDLDTYRIKEDN